MEYWLDNGDKCQFTLTCKCCGVTALYNPWYGNRTEGWSDRLFLCSDCDNAGRLWAAKMAREESDAW